MPQFTPAPSDEVRASVEKKDCVNMVSTMPSGNLMVDLDTPLGAWEVYGDLTRRFGWCIEEHVYYSDESSLTLAPITEVDR